MVVVGSEMVVLGGWNGKPWGDGLDMNSPAGQQRLQSELYSETVEMWAAPIDLARGQGRSAPFHSLQLNLGNN